MNPIQPTRNMKPVESMLTLPAEPAHYASQPILSIRENCYCRFGSTPSTPQHGLYFLLGLSVQIAHNSERLLSRCTQMPE
jgi:hypothetical protein